MNQVIENPIFHVHLENRNVAFANGFVRLYHGGHQFDMHIDVEGKKLMAHRHIISAVSNALKARFENTSLFDPIEVEWQSMSYGVIKSILDYIYNGSVKVYKHDMEAFVEASKVLDIETDVTTLNLKTIMENIKEGSTVEIIYDAWGQAFAHRFQDMYIESQNFDVTLQIDGKELYAHRHVLAAMSNYFAPMFNAVDMYMPLTVPLENMKSVTYESLRDILDFIYLGEVKVPDIVALLNAGEELEVQGLLPTDKHESDRLESGAKPQKIIHIYARTQEFDENKLVDSKCLRKLKQRRAVRVLDDDSDDAMVLRPRKPKVPQNKVANTRKQKVVALNERNQFKVGVTAKKTTTARATPQSKGASKPDKKSQSSSEIVVPTMEIGLTQEEFEHICGVGGQQSEYCAEEEEEEDVVSDEEEEGAVGYTPKAEVDKCYVEDETLDDEGGAMGYRTPTEVNKCYVEDETLLPSSSKTFNYGYEVNNNEHAPSSYDYNQCDYQEDNASDDDVYMPENDCYESNGEDADDQFDYGSQNDDVRQPLLIWDNDVQAQPEAFEQNEEQGVLPPGQPGNIQDGDNIIYDPDGIMPAVFVKSRKGANRLVLNGYQFNKTGARSGYMRWLCSHYNEGAHDCLTYAKTKTINGVEMVIEIPPNTKHTHGPVC